jgi:hypothetical protein
MSPGWWGAIIFAAIYLAVFISYCVLKDEYNKKIEELEDRITDLESRGS